MKYMIAASLLAAFGAGTLFAQTSTPANAPAEDATLRLTSRAVLVDVLVTDSSGKPITGLKQDAFTVLEDGKPQAITYFEEHENKPVAPVAMPQLPQNVFSNFSPYPQPDVVNVLLLDSLNTTMDSQQWVHQQALKFLKSAKPGQRMAIFTMDLGLHFIQGFNDDPAVLIAALENKKNNPVQYPVALKSREETVAQQSLIGMMSEAAPGGNGASVASAGAIAALQGFLDESDLARDADRIYRDIENLQRLAAFLDGFPGRKNVLWFTEKVPSAFLNASGDTNNPAISDEIRKTMAMLAAARAALYPVDPRGASVDSIYSAQTSLPKGLNQGQQMVGNNGYLTGTMADEDAQRNSDQIQAQILAEQSGGQAFANTNGLAQAMDKITSRSASFYTLSYRPGNQKMDGNYRNITVKASGHYTLSYRRGYFAREDALPGSSLATEQKEIAALEAKNPGAVDPLLPFMSLGMPQSEQILYKILVTPTTAAENAPEKDKDKSHYRVDFALDTADLALPAGPDGVHKGLLNVSLIVYDRYAQIISREDHLVQLNFTQQQYETLKNIGVQLHAQLAVPKGNYWLRTGIYDRASHKVGTMEFSLAAVKPMQTAAK